LTVVKILISKNKVFENFSFINPLSVNDVYIRP